MFFSLDPDSFRHPKLCNLTNGTLVYLNGSTRLDLDCSCAAPFPVDPDISGPAIMASFMFLAWFSVLLAIVPAIYGLIGSWQRSRPPYRILKFVGDVLQLRSQPDQPSDTQDIAPPTNSRNSVLSTTSADYAKPARTTTPSPIFPPHNPNTPTKLTEPALVTFCRKLLYPLCDIQIITGLAMIITGLIAYPSGRLTFYSEQFIVNYWWLTLNSLWVSRVDYTTSSALYNGLRYDMRRIAILASVIMACVFQGLVAVREARGWDPVTPGRCYISSDLGGDDYGQNLFWLAGTALYGLILVFTLTSASRRWLDTHVTGRLEPSLATMSGWVGDSFFAMQEYRRGQERLHHSYLRRAATVAFMALKTLSYAGAWLTWWLLVQFLSIWSSGNGSFVIELVVYCVFAGFLTWWLIFLRVENKTLVQGNQDRWTFASTLAVAVLGFAVFYAADVWKEVRDERMERSRKRDEESPGSDPIKRDLELEAEQEPQGSVEKSKEEILS